MAESKKIVLVSYIIATICKFDRWFSLNLTACKVMKAFLIFSGQILGRTSKGRNVITVFVPVDTRCQPSSIRDMTHLSSKTFTPHYACKT